MLKFQYLSLYFIVCFTALMVATSSAAVASDLIVTELQQGRRAVLCRLNPRGNLVVGTAANVSGRGFRTIAQMRRRVRNNARLSDQARRNRLARLRQTARVGRQQCTAILQGPGGGSAPAPTPTPNPTATPRPTPSPTPNPLLGQWFVGYRINPILEGAENIRFHFKPDGSYSARAMGIAKCMFRNMWGDYTSAMLEHEVETEGMYQLLPSGEILLQQMVAKWKFKRCPFSAASANSIPYVEDTDPTRRQALITPGLIPEVGIVFPAGFRTCPLQAPNALLFCEEHGEEILIMEPRN